MRVEVLGGPERRRRWRFEEKARLVAQTFEPGVSVCAVARRNGIIRFPGDGLGLRIPGLLRNG
jgi:Transposase